MYEKWTIAEDDEKIVIKLNLKSHEVSIGGRAHFSVFIDYVISRVFEQNLDKMENIHTHKLYLRYTFKYTKTAWRQAIDYLNENYIIEKVRAHGSLM